MTKFLQLKKESNKGQLSVNTDKVWRILIVDDDEEVHAVTRMVLKDIIFNQLRLQLDSVYSAEEAKVALRDCDDYAMILLDVVMESESAGLQLVHFIRKELANDRVRIVLRTGQPGQAPEASVIMDYDINDYKTKTELTAQKLHTTVITALRSYQDITAILRVKQGMQQILDGAEHIFQARSIHQFASGVLTQLAAFLHCKPDGILCIENFEKIDFRDDQRECPFTVIASAGDYASCMGCGFGDECQHQHDAALLRQCLRTGESLMQDKYVLSLDAGEGLKAVVLLNTPFAPNREDEQLLQLFISKISVGLKNICLYEMLEQRVELRTKELKSSRLRLQGILDTMPDICMCLSPSQQITWASKAVEDILGYSESDIQQHCLSDLLVDADVAAQLSEKLMQGDVPSLRYHMQRADGRNIWINASFRRVDEMGTMEAMLRDVTLEVETELQRKELELRMNEVHYLELLGTMAGGLAHDFNNILSSIIGNIELAQFKLVGLDNSELDDLLSAVIRSSDSASGLCTQMLAYAGKGRYRTSAVNFNRLLEKNSAMLQMIVGQKAVLRFETEAELPNIKADSAQIKQLLVNLLSNAGEASAKGGCITLRTSLLHHAPQKLTHSYFPEETVANAPLVCLQLEDDGSGMNSETLAQVFAPFFSSHFVGRGLGLSAVHGIVRSHHGAIHISSELGKGTCVQCYFPVSDQ